MGKQGAPLEIFHFGLLPGRGQRIAPGSSPAFVQRQQLAQNIVVGDVCRPTVRGGHSDVKGVVCIGEPLRPIIVEVRQRALLERLGGGLVARNRTLRIAGDRLVHPVDPFRRVEPAVAQLDEPLSFQGFRRGTSLTY